MSHKWVVHLEGKAEATRGKGVAMAAMAAMAAATTIPMVVTTTAAAAKPLVARVLEATTEIRARVTVAVAKLAVAKARANLCGP